MVPLVGESEKRIGRTQNGTEGTILWLSVNFIVLPLPSVTGRDFIKKEEKWRGRVGRIALRSVPKLPAAQWPDSPAFPALVCYARAS
jgi:hypothetical protein